MTENLHHPTLPVSVTDSGIILDAAGNALPPEVDYLGRYAVKLRRNGKLKTAQVARLVMEAKLGRVLKTNEHIDYVDKNRKNCAPSNLRLRMRGSLKSSPMIEGKRKIVMAKIGSNWFPVIAILDEQFKPDDEVYFQIRKWAGR